MKNLVEYIPILTTIFAVFFSIEIFKHYKVRKTSYLMWWTIGVVTFGLGTLAESIHALSGWSEVNLKYWYITGALLGGFPLAQGSVYLLMNKKFADRSTVLICMLIGLASIAVIMTPVTVHNDFNGKLTGSVFEWKWARYFSPFINIYSFIFLVGGAVYSAINYSRKPDKTQHFKGNIFIAAGALLPGIGGTFTRMGYVEVLFITEFVGLILIYYGYNVIKKRSQPATVLRNAV